MDTKNFRTKTEFIERKNLAAEGSWAIGLDVGYSSVKVMSPNSVASFPSYARRVGQDFQFVGEQPESAILFKNNDSDDLWLVGEVAQNTMTSGDTSDSESLLYGRGRYYSVMFDVISKTGLALGMRTNEFGFYNGEKIVVETGLPERYMSDADELKDALAKEYNFSIKVGNHDWESFEFFIEPGDIYVISQPKGTLFSACIDKDGKFRSDAKEYLGKDASVLVFDPGFGTLDLFPILGGTVTGGETYSDLGMKRVLQDTCKKIKNDYGVTVDVPSMQKYLETGLVKSFNRKTFESKEFPFEKLLLEANKEVCQEALNRITSSMDLSDFKKMIVTGGTGAAWLNIIRENFKAMNTMQIVSGNQNDNLSFIYNNARGYYMHLTKNLIKTAS